MRVIAGQFRSRPLAAPAGMATRPTSDRLRETLFNVLTQGALNRVEGARFLDLYAGSGSVGIEALSRGAASVTLVEQAAPALSVLKSNLAGLGLSAAQRGGAVRIEQRSVSRFLRVALAGAEGFQFDVVFLDPPYDLAAEYEATLNFLGGEGRRLLAPGAVVVAEHRRKRDLAATFGILDRMRALLQGDAALSFYQDGER